MQFAAKKLTMSDLTLFEAQFRKFQRISRANNVKGSKQKAINLNADIFVDGTAVLDRLRGGRGGRRRAAAAS